MAEHRNTLESRATEDFPSPGTSRLGGGLAFQLDMPASISADEAVVHRVAAGFRKASFQRMNIEPPSLEQAQAGAPPVSAEDVEKPVLEAVSQPESARASLVVASPEDVTMRVDIEDTIKELDAVQPEMVACTFCEGSTPAKMPHCACCGARLEDTSNGKVSRPHIFRRQAPPPTIRAQQRNKVSVSIVSIREDGSDGKEISLDFMETTVGRTQGVKFPTDSFLSPQHARITFENGDLWIEDLYSLNGTFLKLGDDVKLSPGDTFLMGRQVLRFEKFERLMTPKTRSDDGTRFMGSPPPGGGFKILQIGVGGVVQNVYCLPENGAVIGREKGDIIFPHDKFMSSRHAQIYEGRDGECYLVDLNSSNGTWIKIWEKTKIESGHYIFVGQQLFRLQVKK